MCVVAVSLVTANIGDAEHVELDLSCAASSIDRHQDRPDEQATDEAKDSRNFQEAQQEVAIE